MIYLIPTLCLLIFVFFLEAILKNKEKIQENRDKIIENTIKSLNK